MLFSLHDVETGTCVASSAGRSRVVGDPGGRRQDAAAGRLEGTDGAGSGRGVIEQRVGQRTGNQPSHVAAVAPAVCGGGGGRPLEGSAAPPAPQGDSAGGRGSPGEVVATNH